MASSLIKHRFVFGLEDGQWAQDGEVEHGGELGQCHGHVVLRSRPNPDVNSLIFKSYSVTVLRTTMTMASSLIKQLFVFGLEDGQWAQDGEVGQVGELGQCHGHVVLHTDLVEVDRIRT